MATLQIIGWSIVLLIFCSGMLILIRQYTYWFCSYALWVIAGALAFYLLLGILSLYAAAAANICLIVFCVVLGLFVLAVIITGFQISASASAAQKAGPCDYLIVLGCTVDGDRPSRMLLYRITAACEYLNKYPQAQCIVSGGLGKNNSITEARCMYNELTAMGISPQRILLEEQATTTTENFKYSLALLPNEQSKTIAVLSSEFHLFRVKKMAASLGLTVQTVQAKTKKKILLLNNFIREIPAVWFYFITGG